MLRLHRPDEQRSVGGHCVLNFPGSTESRWLDKLPTPGTRIRSHGGHGYRAQVWIVDEVLRSGQDTYTVICVGRDRYLENLRNPRGFLPNLDAELVEIARHARETLAERRRRKKYRDYVP
jgi:hypothetical protein